MTRSSWFSARWPRGFVADAMRDAAHGVRMLLGAPGFSIITLIVFALGIGATTAIGSVADALWMRPLSIPQAEQVVTIWQLNRETGADQGPVAPGTALDWMSRAQSFEAVAIAEQRRLNSVIAGHEPEVVTAARVSEHFFTVLGTPMLYGRAFLPEEYRRGAGRVVILSHDMWRTRFGSDPSIVGAAVRLDEGGPSTIVGVLPSAVELRLFDPRSTQPEPLVWIPKQGFEEFEQKLRVRGYWSVIGRLRPDVSMARAKGELGEISAQLAREHPQTNGSIVAQVVPLRAHLAGGLREVLPLLLGAAAILLLVACANVTNLMLARGAARGKELAVRQALGATRGRLIRQMLMESLLLAILGGAAGLALASWTLDAIARLRPLAVARVDQIPLDARAAVLACGVTLIAAIAAGLAPSLRLSRPAALTALREGRTAARHGVLGALVSVEVAAALVLVVGAALLVRSFTLIQRVDPGFTSDRVAALQVFMDPFTVSQPRRIAFFQQAIERVRALPGVVAAGAVSSMPFGEAKVVVLLPFAIRGRAPVSDDRPMMNTTVIAGDYFRAMNVPLIKGRFFDATDTDVSRQVMVVSQSAARQLWPNADPIGSTVQLFEFMGAKLEAEVVGVVGDVRHEALDRPSRAELFVPHMQAGLGTMTVVVRTTPESSTSIQALKEQIWALDPRQPFYAATTVDQLVSRTLVDRRFNLFLMSGFALATLLLATTGVYGVMSFLTSQRTREFGVRLALGAGRGDIVRLVLGNGLKLAGLGVIVGIVMALSLTRLMQTMLFGVTATDPVTFLSVTIALVLVTAAACYVPASRALKVDPLEALRVD